VALTPTVRWRAAADWWWQADGRYTRGDRPSVGSVLVLRRSGRLPSGHVAVVSQVLGARQILVTQANWVHHRVSQDQSVFDVSPRNDWSAVRVWWPPTRQLGITDTQPTASSAPTGPPHTISSSRQLHAPSALRRASRGVDAHSGMLLGTGAQAASSRRSRTFTYASLAWSEQYGFPGSDASSQNRKLRVPGSPSGQQQVTTRP